MSAGVFHVKIKTGIKQPLKNRITSYDSVYFVCSTIEVVSDYKSVTSGSFFSVFLLVAPRERIQAGAGEKISTMELSKILSMSSLLIALISCDSKPIQIVYISKIEEKATELNETKVYKLKMQTKASDFNYSKLNDIDNDFGLFNKPKNIVTAFEPISGRYNYYQFIATFKGSSYNDGGPTLIKDFNDILIIKTNNENQIIDAYQYTLEWAEPPLQYDVFKLSAKNLLLSDNLKIENLKLIRTYSWNKNDTFLKENDVIKLN